MTLTPHRPASTLARMSRQSFALLAALVLGTASACARSSQDGVVQDSVFVNAMAELRMIGTDTSLDSAARDSARGAVLRAHGLTVEGLESMAREVADDPQRALNSWREIERISEGRRLPPAERERAPTAP